MATINGTRMYRGILMHTIPEDDADDLVLLGLPAYHLSE